MQLAPPLAEPHPSWTLACRRRLLPLTVHFQISPTVAALHQSTFTSLTFPVRLLILFFARLSPSLQIADFGLSRSLDVKTRIQTRTYGTITHQPPETLSDGVVSRETDTYSLGVLMWQMYCGSRPWAGMTHSQVGPLTRQLLRNKLTLLHCAPAHATACS